MCTCLKRTSFSPSEVTRKTSRWKMPWDGGEVEIPYKAGKEKTGRDEARRKKPTGGLTDYLSYRHP